MYCCSLVMLMLGGAASPEYMASSFPAGELDHDRHQPGGRVGKERSKGKGVSIRIVSRCYYHHLSMDAPPQQVARRWWDTGRARPHRW